MSDSDRSGAVPPVVAEVVRVAQVVPTAAGPSRPGGELVESRLRGTVVGLDAAGATVLSVGDPSEMISPRSTVKPMQAVGMLRAGLDGVFGPTAGAPVASVPFGSVPFGSALVGSAPVGGVPARRAPADGGGIPPELLAIVASSHSGEPEHLAAVRAVLAAAGFTEDVLGCVAGLPLGREAYERHLAAGGVPTRLLMNCSGKHAGMIACCAAAGWPVEGYLDPGHPVQWWIRAAIEELTGGPVGATAVDGCGAPLFAVPLLGLARGMRALATAEVGSPGWRVATAMRAHPARIGGPGRPDTELMLAVPWIIAKDGAEGVTVAATASGFAAAVKIEDGSQRAAMPVLIAALRRIGAFDPVLAGGGATGTEVDTDRLASLAAPEVLGGGVAVGRLRAFLPEGTGWPGGPAGPARH